MTPDQFEDPSPTLRTYRGKEEKLKIVEDKKRREQQGPQKDIGPKEYGLKKEDAKRIPTKTEYSFKGLLRHMA